MNQTGIKLKWIGRFFSLLAVLPFIPSAIMKLMGAPQVVQGFDHFGWPQSTMTTIGILEIICVIIYLLPPVSILGGILLTGFLGGAIATHMRIGEPVYMHMCIGFSIWFGLFLREPRLRVLIPAIGKHCTYSREIIINKSPAQVFAFLKPLKNFTAWNPFLKKDPAAKLEYQGQDGTPGFVLSWSGNKNVGSGEQEYTKVVENELLAFDLRFKTPFEANNTGTWVVKSVGSNQTKVLWTMSAETKFPMTILSPIFKLEKMIEKEFDSGLAELKKILEK